MKIGFVGAGKMGLPIAWNIAKKIGPILVQDPHPASLPSSLQEADAARLNFVPALKDLQGCGVVVLCLPDSKVVAQVVEGTDRSPGLLDILAPDSKILDCSSSIPAETLCLASKLAQRRIDFHDAPVSGGLARAWKGDLTVMAGGIPEDSCLLSILAAFTSKIVQLDRVGDGHVMKTANNYLLAANIISFTEALRFARAAGISFEKFGQVVNHSSGASYVSTNKLDVVRLDDDQVSFTSALIAKDVRNFLESYGHQGLTMPLAPDVLSVWESAIKEIGGEVDSMKIFHTVGRRAASI